MINIYTSIVLLSAIALITACSDSSDSPLVQTPLLTQAESAAVQAMDEHMEGRNIRDAERIAAANNYPHARLANPLIIFQNYEIYKAWEELRVIPYFDNSEWHHSVWDEQKIIQSSNTKVHVAAKFSRINEEGDRYLTSETFWIMTEQDGHWGVKMRSSFVDETHEGDTDVEEAEAKAVEVLEKYIAMFNNRDSEGMAELNHYPLVLLQDVQLVVFDTPADYISYVENTVFKDLDYMEWQSSDLEHVEVIQSSPTKIHLVMGCKHFNVVGDSCGQQEEYWVIAVTDGQWEIHGRSRF